VASFFELVNSHSHQLLVEHLGWSAADWQCWLVSVPDRELLGTGEQVLPSPPHPQGFGNPPPADMVVKHLQALGHCGQDPPSGGGRVWRDH
jgi:hypothetical protein